MKKTLGYIVTFLTIGLTVSFIEDWTAKRRSHSVSPYEANSDGNGLSKDFFDKVSTDSWPFMIKVKDHILKIPRNYIVTFDRGSDSPLFILAMTLPDLRGLDKASTARMVGLTSVGAWRNNAPIDVISARNDDESLSALGWNGRTITEAGQVADPETQYGLIKLKGQFLTDDRYAFLSKERNTSTVITCFESTVLNKRRFCSVHFDLAPGLVMQYTYDVSLLPEWRSIDLKVKSLLTSFLEK